MGPENENALRMSRNLSHFQIANANQFARSEEFLELTKLQQLSKLEMHFASLLRGNQQFK